MAQLAAPAGVEPLRRLHVRQVCLLSPVLFLLAIAPVIDVLACAIAPDDFMAMFADDLVIVLSRLFAGAPAGIGEQKGPEPPKSRAASLTRQARHKHETRLSSWGGPFVVESQHVCDANIGLVRPVRM